MHAVYVFLILSICALKVVGTFNETKRAHRRTFKGTETWNKTRESRLSVLTQV